MNARLPSIVALAVLSLFACSKRTGASSDTQAAPGASASVAAVVPPSATLAASADAANPKEGSADVVVGSIRAVVVGESLDAREAKALATFEAALRKAGGAGVQFVTADGAEQAYATAVFASSDRPAGPIPPAWQAQETVVLLRIASGTSRAGIPGHGIGDIALLRPPSGGVVYRESGDGVDVLLHVNYLDDLRDLAKRVAGFAPTRFDGGKQP